MQLLHYLFLRRVCRYSFVLHLVPSHFIPTTFRHLLSRSLSDLSLTPPRVGGFSVHRAAAESARAPDSALLLENSEVFSRVLLVMGVPAFFRWLSRKYPSIVVHCIEEKVRPIVNLAKIA